MSEKLITSRRFLPLFLTQFLGAFNDNLLRNALVVLVTFKLTADKLPTDPKTITTLASALLILPYVIFSSIAGELADKYERSRLMVYTKILEILVMSVAIYGFWTNNVSLLLGLLFGAGLQATFFSPMKYSVLPNHLSKDELIKGNGLIESGTFLAILTGSIAGTLLGKVINVDVPETSLYVGISLLAISIIGLITSLFIPRAEAAQSELRLSRSITFGTIRMVRAVTENKTILKAVLFTSWFWLCGSVFMALFPGYVREVLHGDELLYVVFLTTFSIGIAVGSVMCSKILKNEITPRYTHITLFGVTIFTLAMVGLSMIERDSSKIMTVAEFFSNWHAFALFFSMVATAFCWGVYAVPLKTMIQTNANDSNRSRIIAGENIFNAAFMLIALVINIFLLESDVSILRIFTTIAILNLFVGIISLKIWR
jgi:acyl-[acyl-carrier-protein]-phospholipid O-acyltransferase/long-chain-fatty-acid--[acyl-carrier-protein] ligase